MSAVTATLIIGLTLRLLVPLALVLLLGVVLRRWSGEMQGS